MSSQVVPVADATFISINETLKAAIVTLKLQVATLTAENESLKVRFGAGVRGPVNTPELSVLATSKGRGGGEGGGGMKRRMAGRR